MAAEVLSADVGVHLVRDARVNLQGECSAQTAHDSDPREHLWRENFTACVVHFRMTQRLSYLNGSDKAEFTLARWLGRQLCQMQTGTLPPNRSDQIAVLLALHHAQDL